MAMDPNTPANSNSLQPPQPDKPKSSTVPMLVGLSSALLAVIAVTIWAITRPGAPITVTPTPTPNPTSTNIVKVINTPTPFAGAATFTPVASSVISGPHVLGITAGVGMSKGDIAGPAQIAILFSDEMDQASAQAAVSFKPAVQGNFNWQDRTLFFTPASALTPATDYTVEVSADAKTKGGSVLAAPMSAGFKTAAAPTILRTLPSTGATEVATDVIVTISFNRPMIPLTALDSQPDPSQWATISPAVKGRWVWLGTAAVGFRPDPVSGFQPATSYTLDVKAGWPDATGVTLSQGTTASFTTIKPAILSVTPYNGADLVMIDSPIVVKFNMPMNITATQGAFSIAGRSGGTAVQGSTQWSADSTVMTYTPASLLGFSTSYVAAFSGQVQSAQGTTSELVGGSSTNTWDFTTTDKTAVSNHYPDSTNGDAPPSNSFGFSFNNPIAPDQPIAQYLTISPAPEGYLNQLTVSTSGAFTSGVKLKANTVYSVSLKAGLKDKWGFEIPAANWSVKIGPLQPSLAFKGGFFQPIYSEGPTYVRVQATNLSTIDVRLNSLTLDQVRSLLASPPYYNSNDPSNSNMPGNTVRRWNIPVPGGAKDDEPTDFYATIARDANSDRLAKGYYLLWATAPNPYDANYPITSLTVLIVGKNGAVNKMDQQGNLMVWVADLRTGKPVANYNLRVEQLRSNYSSSPATTEVVNTKKATTGADGVARLKLDSAENTFATAVWSDSGDDAMLATTGWANNLDVYQYGISGSYGENGLRASAYVDRPIYRPGQTVYYKGIYRLDDDASYSLPQAGATVNVRAWVYGDQGQVGIYTGTATLTAEGTANGKFEIPVDAPVGSYTIAMSRPGAALADYYDYSGAYTSFSVEEYRKPDFQVGVTADPEKVHGDQVMATVQASYYFGGPLQNVTTTINLQSSTYYFSWSDPDTDETYHFGEYNPPIWLYDYYYRPGAYPTPDPVQTFQLVSNKDGITNADITKYITTTNGSKSVLVEGQVQDLSNQAVANNTTTVVHQGQYYIGLRNADYIATAKQPTTITVRTVDSINRVVTPNTAVNLKFVRREWTAPADYLGEWKLNEVQVGTATVTTDAQGRATYLFTPPTGGEYGIEATSTDARGNVIRTTTQFYASDTTPGYYTPWRYKNDNAIQLVADKTEYRIGDTAHILVTSPFTQANALLTIERGHVRRYQVITLQGTAPTIDVPLVDGDLPNVYVGLTLLGDGTTPDNAPAGWVQQIAMRQGYVNLSLDTSGKRLNVTVEPQGIGPYRPGTTSPVKITVKDKSGNPAQGAFSLAVVDEAIYAIGGENDPAVFGTFWAERGLGISTSTSFTAGDNNGYGRGGGVYYAGGDALAEDGSRPVPSSTTASAPAEPEKAANQASSPSAPAKVRVDFRDTAFWTAEVTTGSDGTAIVDVPFPDNLTTWRLSTAGLTRDTLAGSASSAMTVTQALLVRPVLPRFLTTGDKPQPQAIVHNNTGKDLELTVSLVVSGSVALDKSTAPEQTITVKNGEQQVVTWIANVDKGNIANFRFWVHNNATGTDYVEDAIGVSLPVKPFAAPEAVATSGEIQGTSGFEGVMIPYTVNPLLGELTVQVSPSLAAATTDSLIYVKEYEWESTDATVSRFLPLVTLEKVYREQGLSTPYSQDIPGIVNRALTRLAELQQPDGGWAWWERGPSSWFETAYVMQGLTALKNAGYAVNDNMYQQGLSSLRNFMLDNSTSGIDQTYNLNMRAYTVYVLSYATQNQYAAETASEASDLVKQSPRMSTHARAWLALALGKLKSADTDQVLDSLLSDVRQTSTLAHWEEGTPDYWSMGTDNRATALAIDALVTLRPDDPIVQKAVRWLMSAEREGHWLSSQETSVALIALAHYMQQSKELSADYVYQVDAFGKLLGQGVANTNTLTQTTTFTLPVSEMPNNTLGDLNLTRSAANGKMYYQMSLKYYVPGEGIKSRSEGLAISRTYYKMTDGVAGDQPVKEVNAGDLVKVQLSIVVPETSYYVQINDPLPAGLEGVNGSLNTTSFTERPPDPRGTMVGSPDNSGYYDWYWRWGPFDNVEMRDTSTSLFASYMSPGTYVYEYYARATTPGEYMALPANAQLMYFPDVFGRSDGGQFTVR